MLSIFANDRLGRASDGDTSGVRHAELLRRAVSIGHGDDSVLKFGPAFVGLGFGLGIIGDWNFLFIDIFRNADFFTVLIEQNDVLANRRNTQQGDQEKWND